MFGTLTFALKNTPQDLPRKNGHVPLGFFVHPDLRCPPWTFGVRKAHARRRDTGPSVSFVWPDPLDKLGTVGNDWSSSIFWGVVHGPVLMV